MTLSRAALRALGVVDRQHLHDLGETSQDFLVEDLLVGGSCNILIGDSGLGKTALMVQLGMAVSYGLPFCGHATKPGIALYIDCESSNTSFRGIVESMERYFGRPPRSSPMLQWSPQWGDFSEGVDDILLMIVRMVEAIAPTLVIIDPLRVVWPRAEIKSEDTVAMIQLQRRLSREHGTTWINVHHCRKPSQDMAGHTPSLALNPHEWLLEAAGSRALINQTDTRLGIIRGNDLIMAGFTRITGPLAPIQLSRLRDDASGDPIAYELLQGTDALNSSQLDFYQRLPSLFTYNEAKSLYRALHQGKLSNSNLEAMFRTLKAAGLIHGVGGKIGWEKTLTPSPATV